MGADARFLVPRIAERFNAGPGLRDAASPQGTKEPRRCQSLTGAIPGFFRPHRDSHDGLTLVPALKRWAISNPPVGMAILAADELHDIAPPVDYSLIPPWVVFAGTFVLLCAAGLLAWWWLHARGKATPSKSPCDRALEALDHIERRIDILPPYRFSIAVSDILRQFVTEQYDLPLTRQTSIEFLNALQSKSRFSEDEKILLADFLNRCDLIKFARYDATIADSRLLLEEATRFVKGGQLAAAA